MATVESRNVSARSTPHRLLVTFTRRLVEASIQFDSIQFVPDNPRSSTNLIHVFAKDIWDLGPTAECSGID